MGRKWSKLPEEAFPNILTNVGWAMPYTFVIRVKQTIYKWNCGGILNQQWCFQSLKCQIYPQHSLTWLKLINCWTLPKLKIGKQSPLLRRYTQPKWQHPSLSICTYRKKQVAETSCTWGSMTPTLRPLDWLHFRLFHFSFISGSKCPGLGSSKKYQVTRPSMAKRTTTSAAQVQVFFQCPDLPCSVYRMLSNAI